MFFSILYRIFLTVKKGLITNQRICLLLGTAGIICPQLLLDSLLTQTEDNYVVISGVISTLLRFIGLVFVHFGFIELYNTSTKSKMANRVSSVMGGIIGSYMIYLYLNGVGSILCFTIGFLFLPNMIPSLKEAWTYLKQSPKKTMHDLKRKDMLMEKDKKIFMNLITGRLWTYVYDVYQKGLNFKEHMDIIRKMLPEKFGIKFPWNGGRIYEQTSSNNRAVVDGYDCFVMSSSGYAAASQNPDILEYAIDKARNTGPNYGSYAVIGFNSVVNDLLRTLEKYYDREAAMVSASGYLACLNIVDFLINSLGGSGKTKTLVMMDRFSHPCLRQGAQPADKVLYFNHNDAEHARQILREHAKNYHNIILIIESVYSTDGDIGDLPAFRKVADEFPGTVLIVDDAHGIGVIGPNAGGVEDYWNMPGACDFICGTLSKACSAQGGFVVSNNKTLIGALVMSPGVGFATGMNAFSAAYAKKALDHIMEHGSSQVVEARRLRTYWKDQLFRRFSMKADENPTRLLTVRLNHPTKAMHVQSELIKQGYLISAMTFPAVPMHQSLLRMTVVPGVLSLEIIDGFCDALESSMKKCEFLECDTKSWLLHETPELAKKDDEKKEELRVKSMSDQKTI